MGENVDPKWIEMVRRMWNSPRFRSVVDPIPEIAALLSRVDAEATERAAMVCDAKAREWNGLLEGGKGEYGKTGYVRDDTWKAWITSEHAARSLASAIRSTLPTPAAHGTTKDTETT